ncbi:MAG: thioredoxin family protein [Flavobacteriales bacterium]|nr:thioredoxin family protein [Flavobacteriales bacterium]MCB9173534.1 thioredoxin family protein [Flavobacteriales bacterium]
MVTKKDIDRSISFNEYYELVEKLANEGGTTGDDQSQAMIDYTKLNFSRIKRILKTTDAIPEITETLACFNEKITWLVIAESWCGDAAQNVPVMQIMAEVNPNITVRVILRDENPELMNQYLTNGGKSIPKLICLDENLNELGTWGPRPQFLQDWLKKEKANPTMEMSALKEQFQVWYTKDKGQTLQKEMLLLMKGWLKKECF